MTKTLTITGEYNTHRKHPNKHAVRIGRDKVWLNSPSFHVLLKLALFRLGEQGKANKYWLHRDNMTHYFQPEHVRQYVSYIKDEFANQGVDARQLIHSDNKGCWRLEIPNHKIKIEDSVVDVVEDYMKPLLVEV